MAFILLDLLFQSYLWRLRLYLSSHITPKIVLNITKTVKIYWYISTFFEVLMICLIFQFLRASYALITRYCEQKQKACSAVIFHILQFFFFDSTLPWRSHEVPPYCLALFLFCDPADMEAKIFLVSPALSLQVQFSFYMARETREIVVRVRNDPRSKPTLKKFNIEEFSVIDVDGTTQRLV